MPVSLCLPPTPGEPTDTVKLELADPELVVSLPVRHLIERVEPAPGAPGCIAIWLRVALERARPVHVRFQLIDDGAAAPSARSRRLGTVHRDGADRVVYGTYLGPASEES
jgi:hypothetical protein